MKIIRIAFLLFASIGCFAGTCPTGTNYLATPDPTAAKVALSSFGVTNCFFIAASGVDTNTGADETHPWLHAPGMPNCTGTCATTTPAAGMGFIFRGGDTWHEGNSAASPYTGGFWSWSGSGTTNNHIYIGVDQTWFSGASWVRPILNGDNTLSTSAVGSCAHSAAGNSFFSASSASFFHFDNFELVGMCWNTGAGGAFIFTNGDHTNYVQGQANPNPRWVENNYIHGWTHTAFNAAGPCSSGGVGIDGASGRPGNGAHYGVIMQFNVIDGFDSDEFSLGWVSTGDTWIVQYNVVRHNGADNSPLSTHLFHDNLFEFGNNAVDGTCATHTDWPLQNFGSEPNSSDFPGDGTPNLFYNNVIRHIPLALSAVLWQFPASGFTDYDFNNVFSDYEGSAGSNYNDFQQGAGGGNLVIFNNTEEGPGAPNPGGGCVYCNNDSGTATIRSANNHWIMTGTGITAWASCNSNVGGTCGAVTESAPIFQTIGVANGQGYTVNNDFAPTASNNSTVTAAGVNETTGFCAHTTLLNTLAEAACVNGITSVSYDSTNHKAVYPSYAKVARPPTGTWNVGAFQFQAGSPLTPISTITAGQSLVQGGAVTR